MTAIVTCPDCDKKFKVRDDAKGKKMRCPACKSVFVVEELKIDAPSKPAAATKTAPKAAAPAAAPKPPAPPPAATAPAPAAAPAAVAPKPDDDEDDENPNPYGVGHLDIRARCPNCANEMESEDAIICLFCGYNNQTRVLGETKKVAAQTGADRTTWLLPGIACVVGIVIVVIGLVSDIYYIADKARGKDVWYWNLINSEALRLWRTFMWLAAIWAMGRFAFKRLLLEPTPPEQEAE